MHNEKQGLLLATYLTNEHNTSYVLLDCEMRNQAHVAKKPKERT